jgi:hypothetical protein
MSLKGQVINLTAHMAIKLFTIRTSQGCFYGFACHYKDSFIDMYHVMHGVN